MSGINLTGGLIFLILGAEMLVRGGASLAARLRISSLVIGLTVVAMGTSSPELAVSIKAVLNGQSAIAIGNVIGSNIFNVLFILGVSAILCPLAVTQQLIKFDVPVMIGISLMVYVLGLDGWLGFVDGLLLIGLGIIYTCAAVYFGRREKNKKVISEYEKEFSMKKKFSGSWVDILLIAAGLTILILGARWFVNGAVEIAKWLGMSEAIIGLTIVAAGTSLPEVATSVMAAIRKEKDIAVGNVVGSNIYNIFLILGISSVVAGPKGLSLAHGIREFDIPFMIAVAAACFPIFLTGKVIARWEGLIFLFYYAVYVAYLILKSNEHDTLPFINQAMFLFVLPITMLTMVVIYGKRKKENS